MSTHTKGAMRAAKLIARSDQFRPLVAEIIDRETGAKEMLEALKLALPKLAHKADCMTCLPTEEWKERGSWVADKCCCEIATIQAAIAKAGGE